MKDVNSQPTLAISSFPSNGVVIGGKLFFSADDRWFPDAQGASGGLGNNGLWQSDGTAAGTTLIKNFATRPTLITSSEGVSNLTDVNGTLFFTVTESNRPEVWKSDGTTAGTVLLQAFNAGTFIRSTATVDGIFYLATDNVELWKSDGVATSLVMNFNPSVIGTGPRNLTAVGGTLYFTADDGTHGTQLWRTDATAGAVMLTAVNSSGGGIFPTNLTDVDGALYFTASDATHGMELWKSDGTVTSLVADIAPGTLGSNPTGLTDVGGVLYFAANDGSHDTQLWRTDATAGIVMVTAINSSGGGISPTNLTAVDGTLYFAANDGVHGGELWKSDGTATGTTMVKDINPGLGDASLYGLISVGGLLYFGASEGIHGTELWKSDGTEAGTVMVKDINPDLSSLPGNSTFSRTGHLRTQFNGSLYFAANDGVHGTELWKSDGTDAGTVLVKDIKTPTGSAYPKSFAQANGTLYFAGNDGVNGSELWKSDGTATGTNMVKDINPGPGPSDVFHYAPISFDGLLYFSANNGTDGAQLWVSDGTEAGTVMVKDITSSPVVSYPYGLTAVGGDLFFAGYDGVSGYQLWKYNPTDGSVMLTDSSPGLWMNLDSLANIDGIVYFAANDGTGGDELWRSDGTVAGTTMVKDINPGSGGSNPYGLTVSGGILYFSADDGTDGRGMWRSDGTDSGTFMISSAYPAISWVPAGVDVNGTFYFTGESELWESNGTVTGTAKVADIPSDPGSASFYANNFININGTLFFTAGSELWKVQGTTLVMIADVPGIEYDLVAVNDLLYFTTFEDSATVDRELWRSDGTASGTVKVADIDLIDSILELNILDDSSPHLTSIGGTLFYSANDGQHGFEPWKLTVDPGTTTAVTTSAGSAVTGQVISFTAAVVPQAAFADTPTGSVTFYDGSTALATVPLDASGEASYSTSNLALGSHAITAIYNGDGSFYVASTSAAINEQINAVTTADFQAVVDALPSTGAGNSITIAPTDTNALLATLSSIAGLATATPLSITLDLGSSSTISTSSISAPEGIQLILTGDGDASLDGVTVSGGMVTVQPGVIPSNWTVNGGTVKVQGTALAGDFIVNGGNVTLADGTVITGHSPAIIVNGGVVTLRGITARTDTSSPTILVTGGTLIVRNTTIQESTGSDQAAIWITGGTVDLGTSTDPGGNTLNVNGDGELIHNASGAAIPAVGDSFTINGLPLVATSSVSGIVFSDFNNDGQVDFGEQGIAGVTITLNGNDFLGNAVHYSLLTDSAGTYVFQNLLPGHYSITEAAQPIGYGQGTNSVGTAGGTVSFDQFDLYLSAGLNALNYNYGERPTATGSVHGGQTAGIGFWNNKNGQALIKALNGGTGHQLGDWLAATFPNMFGANAGVDNLAGKDNSYIAAFFQTQFVVHGQKLDAQVLATALAIYVTNATLDNTGVGTRYGFTVSGNGVATSTFNVGSNGAAFGVADNTLMTIIDLLTAADAQAVNGVLYNGNTVKRNKANNVFSSINEAGGI